MNNGTIECARMANNFMTAIEKVCMPYIHTDWSMVLLPLLLMLAADFEAFWSSKNPALSSPNIEEHYMCTVQYAE